MVSDNFNKAMSIVTETSIADQIRAKMEYFKKIKDLRERNEKIKSIEKEIKKLNDDFKNENYDSMTKMKYRRFRADYQTKRNAINCRKDRDLNTLETRYNIEFNKINTINDEEKRQKLKHELKQKYIKTKNVITIKYDKELYEFKMNYRYTITQMNLKWRYIIHDELDI